MAIFLERMNAAPLQTTSFSFEFEQWVSILVDSLNEVIADIQDALNLLSVNGLTDVEIAAIAADLPDGVILYDTVNNVYVGKASGAMVKFTVTPYP